MKQICNKTVFAMAAAALLLLAGCTKEPHTEQGGDPTPGRKVSVTLPLVVADAEPASVATAAQSATASSVATAAQSATASSVATGSEGFTVSFGEPTATAATASPATRAMAQELSNVWVLQFNASGTNVSTTNTGALAAGAYLTAPSLQVGTGYTIYIIANGPASGLSTSKPQNLDYLKSQMMHAAAATDAATLPLSGKLTGVTVVDLGGGKGKISVKDSAPAMVTMNRIHAEVTLAVDFAVADYTLTSAQLYNVPVGASYDLNSDYTTYPNAGTSFNYQSTAAAGLAPLSATISGTKTTYKWFMGDNIRGEVSTITAQSDRHSAKAPTYATFARITLTNSTTASQKIMYDIYLGSGAVTNFDVKGNHTYTVTAAIRGTAAFQEDLVGVDARVSGTGFPIWLTDNKAYSPFGISSKSKESTATMIWGPTTAIPGAQDVYDGKANTDAIMATNATAYPAAKHCRDQGAAWNLPAQAQLILMWIYLDAIPAADRPASGTFWSSTENSLTTGYAWRVFFSVGTTISSAKNDGYYVRCVREN